MNKESKKAFFVALALVMIGGLFSAVPLPGLAKKPCCIAGNYRGFQINSVKPNCPAPVKETFTMVILQKEPCAAAIGGTITDASGAVSNWTGTVSPGLRDCCAFAGSFLTPSGHTVKFKGGICLKLGKWKVKGTWEEIGSTDPCRGGGTWEAAQI